MSKKVDGFEIDDVEIEEPSVEIEVPEPEEDIEIEEEEQPEEKEPNETVPRKALIAERKKFQAKQKELEDRLAEATKPKEEPFDTTGSYNEAYEEFIEEGFSEPTAKRKAEREVKRQQEFYELKQQIKQGVNISTGTKYDIEFDKLSADYGDISDKKAELIKEAGRTGYTLEQTYSALYGGQKKLTRDEKMVIEQRMINERGRKQGLDVRIDSGTVKAIPKQDLGLSSDEMEMAKLAGLTPKEYALMKKGIDAEAYTKHKKIKKE